MTAPWSQQQREWLQALGHEVLMLGQGSVATTDALSEPRADATIPAGKAGAARRDIPAQAATAASDAPLLRALARAAGRPPQDNELQQVLPDLAALRGNPAARRALWPQLRALRKRGRR